MPYGEDPKKVKKIRVATPPRPTGRSQKRRPGDKHPILTAREDPLRRKEEETPQGAPPEGGGDHAHVRGQPKKIARKSKKRPAAPPGRPTSSSESEAIDGGAGCAHLAKQMAKYLPIRIRFTHLRHKQPMSAA